MAEEYTQCQHLASTHMLRALSHTHIQARLYKKGTHLLDGER